VFRTGIVWEIQHSFAFFSRGYLMGEQMKGLNSQEGRVNKGTGLTRSSTIGLRGQNGSLDEYPVELLKK
jgi:hypothetical protein